MSSGGDIWTPHIYQNKNSAEHLLVLKRDKVPRFVKAAAAAGKELIIGEAGGLWRGGIWLPICRRCKTPIRTSWSVG